MLNVFLTNVIVCLFSDDLFGAPDSDEDDGLFSTKGGLFDSGGGLFDRGNDDDGGLFDDVADVDQSQFRSQSSKRQSSSGETSEYIISWREKSFV